MRSKTIIDKVLNLNESYEIRIPFMSAVIGWGNCVFPTAHILITRFQNEYRIKLYNSNEEGRIYSPHREYEYLIKKDGGISLIYPDKDSISITDVLYISTPFGWDNNMKDTVRQILTVLHALY